MAEINKKQITEMDSDSMKMGVQPANTMVQGGDAQTYQSYVNEASGQQPQATAGQSANDDYFQMAKDQEYGLLFDREIQLENARANAQKYTRNALEAQGFGGTGYGSTLQSGIYNQYMSQLGMAQQDYNSNIRNIEQQQRQDIEAKADDRFKSVTTMLSQAGSVEQMDNLLKDYKLMDSNGEFVKSKPEGMSEDDWYQTKYYYNLYKDEMSNAKTDVTADLANIQYADKNSKISTMGEHFQEEIKYLGYQAQNGNVPDGSYVSVKNGNGDFVYLKYENGGYAQVSKEEYSDKLQNGTNVYELKYDGGKNNWKKLK